RPQRAAGVPGLRVLEALMRLTRTNTVAAAVVVAVAVSGGAAVATTKQVTAVKACVSSKGVLSLITNGKCAKNTHSIALGVVGKTGKTGPAGVTGATGATGPAGTPGQRGPSDLYLVEHPFDATTTVPLAALANSNGLMPTTVESL